MRVRVASDVDRSWIESFLAQNNALRVARRGELVSPIDRPMLIAETADGRPAGLLTYVVSGDDCEILTLHAASQWHGAGSALIAAIRDLAARSGCKRVWVVTTNDNIDALRFYQRRGFRLAALRPGAVDQARRTLKPEIPPIGDYRIPLQDEIDLCKGYLRSQLALIDPKVVVTLGNFATKLLLKTEYGITRLRGSAYPWWRGKSLIPTYHPAAALRSGDKVLQAMAEDFGLIRATLDRPPPEAGLEQPEPEQMNLFA